MMLLCCSFASSSFTLRKSSFLSDDRLISRMYIVWWFLLITMPSSLRFQKRASYNIVACSISCSFTKIVFPISIAFSVSNSRLHICSNSSFYHNVCISIDDLLSLSGVTTLSLLASVCATCMLAYRFLQMKWWAAVTVTVVAIPSQKALWMCPYVSSGKFSVLTPCCSRALLHNLQSTSYRCLIFTSHSATGMIPAIAIISRVLCLQGTCGSFKYFPKNALLSFLRNMKSAVHLPYAGWLILPCSALARTHDFKNFLSSIQVFCCKTFTMLWYDASYRCLCVQSSMSSPLHHLSYRRLGVLICLHAPVSLFSCFCTSFSAALLRIASFTLLRWLNIEWRSWQVTFPASQHGFFQGGS